MNGLRVGGELHVLAAAVAFVWLHLSRCLCCGCMNLVYPARRGCRLDMLELLVS